MKQYSHWCNRYRDRPLTFYELNKKHKYDSRQPLE